MEALKKRRLGNSEVQITALGLGTVPLSGFGSETPFEVFEKVVLSAYTRGVRHFDCAPMYGLGRSELSLGHVMRHRGLRKDAVISTKVGRVLKPASKTPPTDSVYGITWHGGLPFVDTYDYTYDGVMRSFEDSQNRLGLDFVDILFVHDVGRAWHGDRSEFYWDQLRQSGYRALDQLRSEGSVGAIGLGVNETESVLKVAEEFKLDCSLIAGRYSLLNHEPLTHAFPSLLQKGVSIVAGGVFNSGILAIGSRGSGATYDYQKVDEALLDRVRQFEGVCDRYKVALPAAAIQFVSAHPAVASVLVGARSPDEVAQNIEGLDADIPLAFWQDLRERSLIPEEAPVPS